MKDMQQIVISEVATERSDEQILAPNANNHGHVSTAFAWS
ncbi:hypothetical protein GCM10027408_15440 [Microbacterium tumbae]